MNSSNECNMGGKITNQSIPREYGGKYEQHLVGPRAGRKDVVSKQKAKI